MMWSERHRPSSIGHMVGNEEARAAVIEWFSKWKPGLRPLLLAGPPGTGKTTISYLAAEHFGYDIISLNASDARSKARIEELLLPVMGNAGLLGRHMVFIDEADGIHGRSDFGGAEALLKLLKEPTVPIVLAANSAASPKMQAIAKASKHVQFRPLPPRLMRLYLKHVLNSESASLGPGNEIRAVSHSGGDIRSMLNMAQMLSTGFSPEYEVQYGRADSESAVKAFFAAKDHKEARAALMSMRMDPRERISAFYSSVITSKLPAAEMARMMDVISRADALYGKIMRTQQWRLLRYLDGILLGLFRPDSAVKYSKYNLPWPLLNRLRWEGRAIKQLNAVLARSVHMSQSAFASICMPYVLFCIKNKSLQIALDDEAQAEALQKQVEKA